MKQLNLFGTGIFCSHCKKEMWRKPKSCVVEGFLDYNTKEHCCWNCKNVHYEKKSKTKFANMYMEFPVVVI
jgi:hypothetical protein